MGTISRKTGLFLTAIFFAATILVFVQGIVEYNEPAWKSLIHPFVLVCLVMTGGMLASALFEKMAWLQPLIFLVGAPYSIIPKHDSIYGIGFFVMGIILCYRQGFFNKNKPIRLGILMGALLLFEIIGVIVRKNLGFVALMPVFFTLAFILMLYFSYEEKLMVYLKEPKPVVSLAARGLSPLEAGYVFALIAGKTSKEMAVEFDVTESTARNNISRCFHKLGMEDRHSFTIFTTQNEIVD